ncbi:hypothetical protein QYF61_001479 [Mycteria americana]|uniref:Uncharacterized protein n=1 Tax=Mycteria americana TaxID=33587 RepID=A0AAN7NIS3_MYCAM|nr:hypothetical protein QYF61_001479 [Mycteria americana]
MVKKMEPGFPVEHGRRMRASEHKLKQERSWLYTSGGSPTVAGPHTHWGNFNHPDICFEGRRTEYKHSRRFLDWIDDNSLTQVINKPTRGGALLDLLLTKKEELVGDVKVKGSPGCSNHEMAAFAILREASKTWTSGEQVLACSEICPEGSYGTRGIPGGQRGSGKLAELQGQFLQSKGE